MHLHGLILLLLFAFVQAADVQTDIRRILSSNTFAELVTNSDSFEKLCRICLHSEGQMISPCTCKGTQKWVHPGCLWRWQRSVSLSQAKRKHVCNVCKTPFTCKGFKVLIKTLRDEDQEARSEAAAEIVKMAMMDKGAIHDGGVESLIMNLQKGSKEAQTVVAGALFLLATTNENQDVIDEEGGIQTLIEQILRLSLAPNSQNQHEAEKSLVEALAEAEAWAVAMAAAEGKEKEEERARRMQEQARGLQAQAEEIEHEMHRHRLEADEFSSQFRISEGVLEQAQQRLRNRRGRGKDKRRVTISSLLDMSIEMEGNRVIEPMDGSRGMRNNPFSSLHFVQASFNFLSIPIVALTGLVMGSGATFAVCCFHHSRSNL